MTKLRLDQLLVQKKLVFSRSQAENYIKLGYVTVSGKVVTKPGEFIDQNSDLKINLTDQYVSRAALKLASVADKLELNFNGKTVLDVGSSTGGFTDFVLRQGAIKVIAVDVGSDQLHPSLRTDSRIELHEETDIRSFTPQDKPDIVLIDASFISLREILPHIAKIIEPKTEVVAMLKPQFETGADTKNKGVIKNETMRRQIIKDFENWVKKLFVIVSKADSNVAGTKGNVERFYILRRTF